MREYGRIYPAFWTGRTGKQIRGFGTESQLVAVYLLSCPHANMIGLYCLPLAYLSNDTGLDKDCAFRSLRNLQKAEFAEYDNETEFVWVYEMAFYQIGKNLKPKDKQVLGINKIYETIPDNPFLYRFWEKYCEPFHIKSPRSGRPLEGGY